MNRLQGKVAVITGAASVFFGLPVFDEFEAWERGMVDVDVGMGGKLTFSMNFVDQLTG